MDQTAPQARSDAEFDVHMDAKFIYDMLLFHMYSTFGGFCLNIAGLTAIVLGGIRYYLGQHSLETAFSFIIVGVIIIVSTPLSLWLRAKNTMKQEKYRSAIHYRFHDGGIDEMVAGSEVNHYQWSQVEKAVNTPKTISFYMQSAGSVLVFPKQDFTNETFQAAMRQLSRHVVMGKIYIH